MAPFKVIVTDSIAQEGIAILGRDGSIYVDLRQVIIGQMGTIIGNNEISITEFELARQSGGEAIAIASVDNPISKKALDGILKIDGMIEARVVKLQALFSAGVQCLQSDLKNKISNRKQLGALFPY